MGKEKDIFIEGEHIENLFSDDLNPFLKWGMTWLFLVGIALFSLTWFMRWPEVIKAPALLTTSENPKVLVPKLQAKIDNLFFENGEQVRKGDLLATLENGADFREIEELGHLILEVDTTYQENIEEVVNISVNYFQLSNLGDIQSSYEQFQRSYSELKFALSDAFLTMKLNLLNQRAKNLKQLNLNLRLQRNTMYEDYQLAVTTYEKEKSLFEKGSVTAYELKDYESAMLSKRLSFQNTKNSIIQNERQQQDIIEQKIQLTQSIELQKNNFIQAFKNLKSAYGQWKNMYQLISPIDGIVSIPSSTQQDAVVTPQAPALYVLPKNSNPIIQMQIPQNNFNAVDSNKTVRIKLTAYPFEDFGVLEGKIKSISKIPTEGNYEAVVVLTDGLTSSFGKQIEFINGLSGEAEIILDDERLMVRLFRKLKSTN